MPNIGGFRKNLYCKNLYRKNLYSYVPASEHATHTPPTRHLGLLRPQGSHAPHLYMHVFRPCMGFNVQGLVGLQDAPQGVGNS